MHCQPALLQQERFASTLQQNLGSNTEVLFILRYSPYPLFRLSNGVIPIPSKMPLLLSSQESLLQSNKQAARIKKRTSMRGGMYVRLLFAIKTRSKFIVIALAAFQQVLLLFEFQNFHLRSDIELLLLSFDLYFIHNQVSVFRELRSGAVGSL